MLVSAITEARGHAGMRRIAFAATMTALFTSIYSGSPNGVANPSQFSDLTNKIIDLRDFGLKAIQTTGSISAGSNQLILSAPAGFAVGDRVIVAIGGEAGAGMRGTRGVGGTWPALSYATASAMNAERWRSAGTFAWVTATGDVYHWNGSSWGVIGPARYYTAKALPKALLAQITAIGGGGTQLTLSTAASVATTGASVYYDNQTVFNNVFSDPSRGNGWTVTFPEGSYAVGDQLQLFNKTGWTFHGATKDTSTIFSPTGTPSAMVRIDNSPNTTVRDMHLLGNAGNDKYGLQWGPNSQQIGETFLAMRAWPSGFFFSGSPDCAAQDLKITDAFQHGTVASYSDNLQVIRAHQIITQPRRQYLSWMFQFADSTGGSCTDCSIDSNYLTNGFEIFRSRDVQYIRPVGRNASFATNAAGNFLIEGANLVFDANSQLDDAGFSRFNPIFDINNNIQDPTYLGLGGIITNVVMMQKGYINATNDILRGIVINVQNITVDEGLYTAPDWATPGANGPWGFDSIGSNTRLSNFTVVGTPRPGDPNISVSSGGGSLVNLKAKVSVWQ